jgi:hypothetical protein
MPSYLLLSVILFGHPHFSCLKPDGDWLDGVTKKQCISLNGRWMVKQ